jgi:predicted phosphate transport protein (TIGR00153 family)
MGTLFSKTKELVLRIDNFIDLTSESALHFKEAVRLYLEGNSEEFELKLDRLRQAERQADTIRKNVEGQLYRETLIPESRGDVLGVLESMDSIIDRTKYTIQEFAIEQPAIPAKLNESYLKLTEQVVLAVESLSCSVRAYFHEITAVKDHLHKVKFYESESDRIAEKLKRDIFRMKLNLSVKMHLKSFVDNIDILADYAESVSDRIGIATIKRIV